MATIDVSQGRDAMTQAAIMKVAKRFLRRHDGDEKQWLRRILGHEPRFTFTEAKTLFSRLGAPAINRLVPLGPNHAHWPAMYNWALTVDRVMTMLKTMAAGVASYDGNVMLGQDLAYLQTLILHPSFRPWDLIMADANVPFTAPEKFAQSLISNIDDPGVAGVGIAGARDLKGKENVLLAIGPIDALIALAQGNYMRYFRANAFTPQPGWTWQRTIGAGGAADFVNNAAYETVVVVAGNSGAVTMHGVVIDSLRLEGAIKRSGVTAQFNKYYRNLQVEFARVVQFSAHAQPDPYGPGFGRQQISGPMVGNAMKCGRGMMPVYLDSIGNPVEPRNAFIKINGKKYLSHMVDPNKSYCQPMVGAFGAQTTFAGPGIHRTPRVMAKASLPFDASAPVRRRRKRRTTVVRRTTVAKRKPAIRRRRRRTTTVRRRPHRAMLLQNNNAMMLQSDEARMGAMLVDDKANSLFAAPVRRRRRRTTITKRRKPASSVKRRVVRRKVVRRKRKPAVKRLRRTPLFRF